MWPTPPGSLSRVASLIGLTGLSLAAAMCGEATGEAPTVAEAGVTDATSATSDASVASDGASTLADGAVPNDAASEATGDGASDAPVDAPSDARQRPDGASRCDAGGGTYTLSYVKTVPIDDAGKGTQGIEVYGNRVYAVSPDYTGRVYVFDASSVATMTKVNDFDVPGGSARHVVEDGNRLFVGGNYNGLFLFDRADAAAAVANVSGAQAYGVAVASPFAFVAGAPGGGSNIYFQSADFTTPTNPTKTSLTWTYADAAAGDRATAVALYGTTAYVNFTTGAMRVLDVATPASPTLVTTVPMPGAVPAYSCWGRINRPIVDASRKILIVPRCERGATLLDLTTPQAPAVLSSTYEASCGVNDVYVEAFGDTLFTHNGSAVHAYDISNPASPYLLGTTSGLSGLSGDMRMAPDGKHLLVAASDGIRVYALP